MPQNSVAPIAIPSGGPALQEIPRKRVLFVDDEPHVLVSLQRLLRPRCGEWEMIFVDSGEDAIARLHAEHFDVVVSDMRMPGVDGMQLLSRVRAELPHTVRIVLSGHSELEEALRVMPVAHQFLAKPCDADALKAAIDRSWRLQGILGDERIRRAIGRIELLPSPPRLCRELSALVADPDASLVKVAQLIEQEPAMAAKVLQLVNSSFFGLSRRATSLREAVSALGLNLLRNLILSLSLFRVFSPSDALRGFSCDRLQAHSFAVARLAKRICPAPEHAEDAFISALLADVGQLVLAAHAPSVFAGILDAVIASGVSLHEAEIAHLGVSHAEIGAYLLGQWDFPYAIVESVAHHHDAARIPKHRFLAADSAFIAHALVQATEGAPHDPFDVAQPPLDGDYLRSLGVSDEILGWRKLAAELVNSA